jgi:hypothetical protein
MRFALHPESFVESVFTEWHALCIALEGHCHDTREVPMDARNGSPLDGPRGTPPDRRDRDGDAGAGDMLGGLSTGAGGTMGVETGDRDALAPGEGSEYHHRFGVLDPDTDSATTVHSVADVPPEGA